MSTIKETERERERNMREHVSVSKSGGLVKRKKERGGG